MWERRGSGVIGTGRWWEGQTALDRRRRFALVETELSGNTFFREGVKVFLGDKKNGSAYAGLGEVGDCGESWSRGDIGEGDSCEGFLLKMKDDDFAKSFGMRERGWGSGMRTHSSSKRTPLASMVMAVDVMMGDVGGSIGTGMMG